MVPGLLAGHVKSRPELLSRVKEELVHEHWNLKNNDLYNFSQTNGIARVDAEWLVVLGGESLLLSSVCSARHHRQCVRERDQDCVEKLFSAFWDYRISIFALTQINCKQVHITYHRPNIPLTSCGGILVGIVYCHYLEHVGIETNNPVRRCRSQGVHETRRRSAVQATLYRCASVGGHGHRVRAR